MILGFKRISLVFQHVRDRNRGAYDLDPRIPFLQGAYKIQHHAEFYARIEIDTGDPVSGQCLVKQAGEGDGILSAGEAQKEIVFSVLSDHLPDFADTIL